METSKWRRISFSGSGHSTHRPIQYFTEILLSTVRKVKCLIGKWGWEVNNDCDYLRTYREIVEFEQGIEIFRALVEMEMVKEGTGARRKIGIRRIIMEVRKSELVFTTLNN